MGLRPSVIDVPLLTLNQTPADRQGPVGRLTDAKNVVVTHYDVRSTPPMIKVQQRNAYVGMETTCRSPVTGAETATAWANPELLSSLGRQILSVCNAIPRAWNDNAFTAYDDARVVPNRLDAEVFHTSQKTIQADDEAWLSGVTCSVWTETVIKAQTAVEENLPKMLVYIGFKDDNGAWVIPPKLLYDPGGTTHEDPFWIEDNKSMARVVQDGDVFWVVYNGKDVSTPILTIQAYATTGELLDQTQITQLAPVPAGIGYWDIQAVLGGGVIVAQPVTNITDSGVRFTTATYAGGISITANTDATIHCVGPLAWMTNELDGLHYLETMGLTFHPFAYQITAMAQTHEFAFPAVISTPDGMTGWVRASGVAGQPTAFIVYSQLPAVAASAGPAFDPQLRYTPVKSCTWGGSVAAVKQLNSLIPMTRAFEHDGEYYAITYYQSGSGLTTGATTEEITHTAGDYMTGDLVQAVDVAAGDYVSGSPGNVALYGTAENGHFSMFRTGHSTPAGIGGADTVAQIVSSGLLGTYGIPDGVSLLKWDFATISVTGSSGALSTGALLVVGSSSIASANGSWDIVGGPTQSSPTGSVYTKLTNYSGGTVIPGTFTATGSSGILSTTAYCAPNLADYVHADSTELLLGGSAVVSGLFGGDNGTFTVLRAVTEAAGDYTTYFRGPAVWVQTTTQGPFEGIPASMVLSATPPNTWHFASNAYDDSLIGATLEVTGDPRDENNGDFAITGSLAGNIQTAGETALVPEVWSSPLPTITIHLPVDIVPLTFKLQSLTVNYRLVGATIAVQGASAAQNNGAYLITQVDPSTGLIYTISVSGISGQLSLAFTGAETITITYPAAQSPEFQPTYFMTPLEDVDTAQVGCFERGIAYGDWRFDGTTLVSMFPLALSSVQTTNAGIQWVLPFRAESFTATVSNTAPNGSVIPVSTSTGVSTVGLKTYVLSDDSGEAGVSGGALLLPGPLAGEFSASGFHENGVNIGPEAPWLVSQQTSDSPVAQTAGTTRQYVAVFEETDENGDRVFSIPSPALNVTLVGDATSATISGRLPSPLDGNGAPVANHIGPTNRRTVGISIYATSYQGSVPTLQHFKITNDLNVNGLAPISTTNASGFTFPDEFTWEYLDENPGANILTGEVLYTDKGYLPRFPAPAFRHASTWKNREFLAAYDGALWMSGEKTEGDATWFFPAFRFTFGNDVPLASAPMDDYLVVTCAASVWVIPSATLPDGTGRNGTLPTPIQLPFQNGGTGLATALRPGVAYTSTAGGVWLITRDLKNVWLSQPIQDLLTIAPTSMAVDENQRLHVVTGTSAEFVYDQVVDAWYRWALPTSSAKYVTILDGQAAWEDNARVALYTPGVYADSIADVTYGIPPDVTFSSLQFGNTRGLKACWAFIIQGTYKGPHNLNVEIGYPDENPDAPTSVYGPFVMTNDGPYVVEANPNPEEASSFDVRVFADFDGVPSPGNSFEFEVLSAEVGFDRSVGVNKPTKQMRAG